MTLNILHEGFEDKKFFETFIAPFLRMPTPNVGGYRGTKVWQNFEYFQYSTQTYSEVKNYITIVNQLGEDYIIIGDADYLETGHQKWRTGIAKTYTDCINYLYGLYNHSIKNIFIVVEEIESWFLCGFDASFCASQNPIITFHTITEVVTKELFEQASLPLTHIQLIDKLCEMPISIHFDISHAKTRNQSFRIFCDAMGL